ncbi:MAG: glutamine-hydrolyzing carbamoyl-phosphate synthase small subunit [Dehalococcoidia bacterium]|nr:glutamine-hydrolyzing carbamoyl-phosphate synthase small subunit [Dehalococcoidia bacterium]
MAKRTILLLEDASVYEGYSFGAEITTYGEVVFDTSMTGYQEMLTDPSFAGQVLVPTYPLVGNYGICETDFESRQIQVRGLAVRESCSQPSHWQSSSTLHEFLLSNGIPGISGIDTRALTRHIRSTGVMMGIITSEMTAAEALQELRGMPKYDSVDFVHQVTTDKSYEWQSGRSDAQALPLRAEALTFNPPPPAILRGRSGRRILHGADSTEEKRGNHHIVIIDLGLKYNTLRILRQLGCRVTVIPCSASAEYISALKPDGIVLSPGPGDPSLLNAITDTVRKLVGKKPMMGICLGHQLISRALGARTFKLKFGHRGGNHPVRDLATGKVYITAQNHGYAIDPDTLPEGLEVSHINLNDGTVEGLRHRDLPILSIQYHPEASPGPQDNVYLFERFLDMVEGGQR